MENRNLANDWHILDQGKGIFCLALSPPQPTTKKLPV